MKSPPIPRALSPLSSLSIPLSLSSASLSPLPVWTLTVGFCLACRHTCSKRQNPCIGGVGGGKGRPATLRSTWVDLARGRLTETHYPGAENSLSEPKSRMSHSIHRRWTKDDFFHSVAIGQRSHLTAKWENKTFWRWIENQVQLKKIHWLTNVSWKSGIETITLISSLNVNNRVVKSIYPNASKPPQKSTCPHMARCWDHRVIHPRVSAGRTSRHTSFTQKIHSKRS